MLGKGTMGHRQQNQQGQMTALKRMAWCIAALAVVLCAAQLNQLAVFLCNTVLMPQFGYELTSWIYWIVLILVFGTAFYAAQIGLASSIISLGLAILLKMPF